MGIRTRMYFTTVFERLAYVPCKWFAFSRVGRTRRDVVHPLIHPFAIRRSQQLLGELSARAKPMKTRAFDRDLSSIRAVTYDISSLLALRLFVSMNPTL